MYFLYETGLTFTRPKTGSETGWEDVVTFNFKTFFSEELC